MAVQPPSPAKLYGWSEDSPVVRIPKYLLQFADIRLDSVLTNYQLTDIAIDVLGLNETEAQQANQLLTEAFTTYDAVEASHTRPVTQPLSDLPLLDEAKLNLPAGEKRSFLTTLPPEVRTDLKARLLQGLETSVGEARASLCLQHTQELFDDMLGRKGTMTKVTTVLRPEEAGKPIHITQQCFEDGRRISSISQTLEGWQKWMRIPEFIKPTLAEWSPPSR